MDSHYESAFDNKGGSIRHGEKLLWISIRRTRHSNRYSEVKRVQLMTYIGTRHYSFPSITNIPHKSTVNIVLKEKRETLSKWPFCTQNGHYRTLKRAKARQRIKKL